MCKSIGSVRVVRGHVGDSNVLILGLDALNEGVRSLLRPNRDGDLAATASLLERKYDRMAEPRTLSSPLRRRCDKITQQRFSINIDLP